VKWRRCAEPRMLFALQQAAYCVTVSGSAENLHRRVGDVWDSGRVESVRSAHVPCGGADLGCHSQMCRFLEPDYRSITTNG